MIHGYFESGISLVFNLLKFALNPITIDFKQIATVSQGYLIILNSESGGSHAWFVFDLPPTPIPPASVFHKHVSIRVYVNLTFAQLPLLMFPEIAFIIDLAALLGFFHSDIMIDITHQVSVNQMMILLISVGKVSLDFAIDLIPVTPHLGLYPALQWSEFISEIFAFVVRSQLTIMHFHLATLRQAEFIFLRFTIIESTNPESGFQITIARTSP